jgi:hypothetical protein
LETGEAFYAIRAKTGFFGKKRFFRRFSEDASHDAGRFGVKYFLLALILNGLK